MNLDKPNSSVKYPLLIGGLTAAAGLGYLYYRNMQSRDSSDFELSRKQVVAILKEFRKDFYPIFKYLTNLSQTIQNDYKKKFNYIPDNIKQNLSTMLIDENPAFKEQVYAMEDRIYSKFEINNRSSFEGYVLKLAKTDPDVQALVNDIKNDFRKSVMGVATSENVDLPDIINPDLILQIYKDSLKLVLQRILSFVAEYKERHGEINAYDENFAMQLKDLNLEQMKLKVLEERGLGGFEDYHPERIFHFALSKFSKENQSFKERLLKMEVFHQGLMQKLFAPNANITQLQQDLLEIDKFAQVEEAVIKEVKDQWEDVQDDEEDQNNQYEENKPIRAYDQYEQNDESSYGLIMKNDDNTVVVIEQPNEEIIVEAKHNDVVITERTGDSTTVTHFINNEVVEQIQEIHIHPTQNNSNNDTPAVIVDVDVLREPVDTSLQQSTDDNFIELSKSTETSEVKINKDRDNKDKDFLIANVPNIELDISHNEAPPHEVTSQDFVKTGEPVFEEIEGNEFTDKDAELTPVPHYVAELDQHKDSNSKPRLNLDE